MSSPTVVITVLTTADEPEGDIDELVSGLYMLYVQAVLGDQRRQYVLFPPARKVLGIPEDKIVSGDPMLLLSRVQAFKGNRSKWFHTKVYNRSLAETDLSSLEQSGWTLGSAIAVPLEQDDYIAAWNGETPHKAMRAVGRMLKPLGIDVK